MAIENELKQLILDKYGSVRSFTQSINIPYSTIDSMLKRGIDGTSVSTVLLVCLALNIDIEGLLNGEIIFKPSSRNSSDLNLSSRLHRLSDLMEQMNEEGQEKLLDYAADLVAGGRYKKVSLSLLENKNAAAARSGDRMNVASVSAAEEEAALPSSSHNCDI